MITLSGSNYPCLEQNSIVPKMDEPMKFYYIWEICRASSTSHVVFLLIFFFCHNIYCLDTNELGLHYATANTHQGTSPDFLLLFSLSFSPNFIEILQEMSVHERSESGDHLMLTVEECASTKVKVKPKRGSAVFWYNHIQDEEVTISGISQSHGHCL